MHRPTEGQTDIACHSRVQRSVTSGPPVKTNLGDDVRDVKATKRRVYGELIQMLNEARTNSKTRKFLPRLFFSISKHQYFSKAIVKFHI